MLGRASKGLTGRHFRRHHWIAGAAALAAGAGLAATAAPSAMAATPTAPPPITVLTAHGAVGRGDIFITPSGDATTYENGAEILSPTGQEIWFHQAPAGDVDGDFRTQTYDGQRVLTFWEGSGFGGLSTGTDYIYNDHYQEIAAVHADNGLNPDGHEFLIRGNDAWILSYTTGTTNLTSIGGPAAQTVIDGIVQEIDIKTGKLLFQWNSAEHVPYGQSEQPLPAAATTPWDWFHINAVHFDTDGNLLISARDTWTVYKVSPRTGHIIWQLGGKASSFTLQAAAGQSLNDAGDIFAWQHDPEGIGHGQYTVFDNESAGAANTGIGSTNEFGEARIVRIQLDESTHTATLIQSYDQPEGQVASSQGDGQPLPGGGAFVGWGILPYISEFSHSGELLFNAEFPAGAYTYRAYLLPWAGSNEPGASR
jgi:hypothetical protein